MKVDISSALNYIVTHKTAVAVNLTSAALIATGAAHKYFTKATQAQSSDTPTTPSRAKQLHAKLDAYAQKLPDSTYSRLTKILVGSGIALAAGRVVLITLNK